MSEILIFSPKVLKEQRTAFLCVILWTTLECSSYLSYIVECDTALWNSKDHKKFNNFEPQETVKFCAFPVNLQKRTC